LSCVHILWSTFDFHVHARGGWNESCSMSFFFVNYYLIKVIHWGLKRAMTMKNFLKNLGQAKVYWVVKRVIVEYEAGSVVFI